MGEDLAGARLAGGDRLSQHGRPVGRPRCARLQPRGLWLHHLHRQLRPAAGSRLRSDRRQRPGRHVGAVGQPQLRRPREPGRAGELPGLAAAGGRLRARRLDATSTSTTEPLGTRTRRRAGLSRGRSGRPTKEIADIGAHRSSPPRCSPAATPTCSRATSSGRRSRSRAAQTYGWTDDLHLRAEPALFRRHDDDARARHRHGRTARILAPLRRLDHHRPHLARRLDLGKTGPAGEYLREHQVPP